MRKFSIIIPLYNKEHCIAKTIESVLSQNYSDLEIIIVNDGSTDSSLNIVKGFEDPRLRIINKSNEGVSKTRNRGIKEANASWLVFLDADDVLLDGALLSMDKLIESYSESNFVSCNYRTVYANGTHKYACSNIKDGILGNPFNLMWIGRWNTRLGSFAVKKDVLITDYLFPEHVSKGEDIIFVNRLLNHCTVAYATSCAMEYIRENSSLSSKPMNIDKTLSWNVNCDSKNRYYNLVCGRYIAKGFYYSLFPHVKIDMVYKLFMKQKRNILWILGGLLGSRFIK